VTTPNDVDMPAAHYETELYYRLLQSSMGDTLRQIGQRDAQARHIKAATDRLAANNRERVVIPDLAASAGMSETSFHRQFKAITGYSPLAFQKHMRQLEARKLFPPGAPPSRAWPSTSATPARRSSAASTRACSALRLPRTCRGKSAAMNRRASMRQMRTLRSNRKADIGCWPKPSDQSLLACGPGSAAAIT